MTDTTAPALSAERADLIAMLAKHRGFLLTTAQGLSDEQARLTPTVSELSVGGLIKHVTATEAQWLDFIEHGPADFGGDLDWENIDPAILESFANGFKLVGDETLASAVAAFDEVHARAEQLAGTVDLEQTHPLPDAPWFEPGQTWSNRRVFMHIVAETSQHAGHADILRETIDGQKTMG